MRLVSALIIAVAVILAPVLWFVLPRIFGEDVVFDGPAIDSGARIEIEMMRQQVEDMAESLENLRSTVDALTMEVSRLPAGDMGGEPLGEETDGSEVFRQNGTNDIIDAYAQVVLIAERREVNKGLRVASPEFLEANLGRPREVLSDTCEAMTNSKLRDLLVVEQVGPIRVRMLRPAIESLKRVFENVRITDPDLYARINTAGALCVRRIRGTQNRLSTHSYGLAVDLNIDGRLDTLGDGRTQLGLTILADFFNTEGWVWGAAFGREDSMHFEISQKQLEEWLADGSL